MSSSKSISIVAKILCVLYIMSLVGSKSGVEAGVVINGASLSNNRPSPLVSSAMSIYNAVHSGQISSDEGRRQGQLLIQQNQAATNQALINGIRG